MGYKCSYLSRVHSYSTQYGRAGPLGSLFKYVKWNSQRERNERFPSEWRQAHAGNCEKVFDVSEGAPVCLCPPLSAGRHVTKEFCPSFSCLQSVACPLQYRGLLPPRECSPETAWLREENGERITEDLCTATESFAPERTDQTPHWSNHLLLGSDLVDASPS